MKLRSFKANSFRSDVSYVLIGKDSLGWKLDAFGYATNEIPHGDTCQDTLDEFMPFLKLFVDESSVWSEWDSEVRLSFWEVISVLTEDF
jgi:hypothetical protein